MSVLGKLALATAGLGAVSVAGALIEARAYRVVRHAVRLGAGSAPPGRLRILHLSDVHYVPGQLHKLAFLAGLAELEPDLVVCTGDLLSADAGLDELTGALTGLLERPGVFVFGSNDYYASVPANPLRYFVRRTPRAMRDAHDRALDWRAQRDVWRGAGWADLTNARAVVSAGGFRIELRGTDDAHIQLDDYPAVAGAAADGVDVSLGVTHAPYRHVLDAMCADGLPLILAGHTHGGQIGLPGRALVANCDLPVALASGLHRYVPASGGAGAWLHVSAGLGTSPYVPLRLFCRPEACVLDVELA